MLQEPTIKAAVRNLGADVMELWLRDSTGERRAGSLALRIRQGRRSPRAEWFAMWKLHGVRHRLKLGVWPDLTLAAARVEYATKVRPLVLAGRTPRGGDGNGTLAQLFAEYCEKLTRGGSESVNTIRNALNRLAKKLGQDRVANQVTTEELADALRYFHGKSAAMAGKMRSYCSSAYNYGMIVDNDFRAGRRATRFSLTTNPAESLPAVRSNARARVLTADELRAWWWGFPEHAETWTVHALRVALLTCGRINEITKARPGDFQLSDLRWNKRVKRQEILTSPVGQMAAGEIRAFTASMRPGKMAASRVADYVNAFCEATGCEKFQARDLRRTARTWLSDKGEDREVLDLQFSHNTRAGVRSVYDHAARIGDRRAMLCRWEAMVAAIINEKPAE